MTAQLPPNPLVPPTAVAAKRLLVVDDHPIFRHGISQLIGQLPEVTICGQAENASGALEAMRRLQPEVVVMDVSMPGMNGIELIKLMLAEQPRLLILVLSIYDESLYALRALRAGAKGYVMKQKSKFSGYCTSTYKWHSGECSRKKFISEFFE